MTKTKLARLLSLLLFSSIAIASAAQVTLKGKVTDSKGAGIPAISVVVKNSSNGTTTANDGSYTLVVLAKTGTLSFSGVGFKNAEKSYSTSGNEETVNVSLDDDVLGLDEVVVTGNKVATKKKELAYQVTTINAKNLRNTGTQNAVGALQGKIPGAQVLQNTGDAAGGFSVRLRGIASFSGSSEPLYIVDGVIVNNSSSNVINLNADGQSTGLQGGQNRLVDLNPNDIERIEVINGAAAAATYGPQAANGVVQIFTKKGAAGKPRVTFSTSIQNNSLLKKLEFNKHPFRFGYASDARYSQFADRLTTISNSRPDQATRPGAGPVSLGGRLDTAKYAVNRYDYQDGIFGNTWGIDNFVGVTGGTDKTVYAFSASYSKNDGITLPTSFTRYGVKARVEQRFADNFKAAVGLNYTNSSSKDLPNGNNFFSPVSIMAINDNVWDANEKDASGNLKHMEFNRMNVFTPKETFDITQTTNRIVGDLQLSWQPIAGMSLTYTAGVDNYALIGNTYQPRVAYFFNPTVSTTQQVAATAFPDGYVAIGRENFFSFNNEILASYVTSFMNGDLKSTTSAGYSYNYNEIYRYTREGRDLQAFGRNISAARNFFTPESEFRGQQNISGFFLQQGFGYKGFLFATAALRRDQSSAYSDDAIGQILPRATLAFLPTEMEWFQKSSAKKWLNTFKLRAAYGQAFIFSAVQYFGRFTTYSPISYVGGLGGYTTPLSINDRNIKPEIRNEFEIGADMEFLNGRIALTANYYNQKTEDLIVQVSPAPTVGGTTILSNVGTMSNKGLELLLTVVPIQTKDMRWSLTANFNKNTNLVEQVRLAPGYITTNAGTQGIQQGYAYGIFNVNYYARKADGSLLLSPIGLPQVERGDLATNTPQRDAGGQPTGSPLRKIFGSALPDWTGSLITEFSYKKFNFRIQFDHSAGGLRYNWNKITFNNVGNGPMAEKELKGELPRGWVAAIGGFIGPRIQEEHLEDGTYTKLRELQISYNIGKIKKFGDVTIGLTGRNLLLITNYTGYDPETNSGGQSTRVLGDDFGNTPIPRTIALNINVTF
jgi:TonB-linked SusC/RagA family outer membrane protein